MSEAETKKAPAKPKPKRKKTGGRKKGSPNVITREVREMIVDALVDLGGAEYLKKMAKKNTGAFATLIRGVLPLQVTGAGGKPLIPSGGIKVELEVVPSGLPPSAT